MVVRNARTKELQRYFDEAGNSFVLLCGSSRSEKEALIKSFCRDKNFFYYRARNASPAKQFALLSREIEEQYDVMLSKGTYDDCFSHLKSSGGSKLVLVIDEFALVSKRDNELLESLVNLKQKKLYPGPVMIIVTASSLAWLAKDMPAVFKGYEKELDATIVLDDMKFLDIVRTMPKYSVAQAVMLYGILGGVPAYIDCWNGNRDIRENVIKLIVSSKGELFSEAEDFIARELRELAVYDTILAAMAEGNEKLNDIFKTTGYSRAKISVYLKNLAAFDVIEKVVSFETGGWENAKKGVYRIKNHFVDFWFHFIYPNQSKLYVMQPDDFYDKYIAPGLDSYLRRYFVDVCKEFLELLNSVGKLPIRIEKMGTWIGKNGTIDVIGRDALRECVVGVCNWDAEEMAYERYEQLLDDMKSARIKAKTIYLFSAKTFDERLKALEKQEGSNVVLVDMTEL